MHPVNRDGDGVRPLRANTRVEALHTGGCSVATLEKGLCAIEDHPFSQHIANFAISRYAQSPEYAKYVHSEIKGGDVAGAHCAHG